MKQFFTFFVIFFLVTSTFASEHKMYLLPKESKQALRAVTKELSHAKKEVKITIYNFTYI